MMEIGDLVRIIKGSKNYRGSVGVIMSFADELSSTGPGYRVLKAFFPLLDGEMWWTENYLEVISESR
tara:strand:- start:20 stop:220 length:201 start_codon:yes stop_codon:yes gene_type:complete